MKETFSTCTLIQTLAQDFIKKEKKLQLNEFQGKMQK